MADTGKTIHLDIITPDAAVLQEDVTFILVRALDGDVGIMPNHAPLIASLAIWPLSYEKNGQRHYVAVSSGFLEVRDNTVTVIAPSAELPENIDVARATKAKERAEQRLGSRQDDIDVERAECALKRALCRLDVVQKQG